MAPVSHLLSQIEPPRSWLTDSPHRVGSCLLHHSIIAIIAILFFLLILSVPFIHSLFSEDDTEFEDFDNFPNQQDHSQDGMETLLVTVEEYDTFVGLQDYFLDEKTFSRVNVDDV